MVSDFNRWVHAHIFGYVDIMITNLRTKAKFYEGKSIIYSNLFARDMQIYFCYRGAEYKHIGKKTFHSVSAKSEEVREIIIADWHREALNEKS